MNIFSRIREKLNPAQPNILLDEGNEHQGESNIRTFKTAYDDIEVVNRGCNLIVDSSAELLVDIGTSIDIRDIESLPSTKRIRKAKLLSLLNHNPNPYVNADTFKRIMYMDLILDGNAFIYFDGAHLYNLPANNVNIVADEVKYIKQYEYADKVFNPEEIIHIKENSSSTIYRGTSRLKSCSTSLKILGYMLDYQSNFFKNNAIPGLVLKTPNVLSRKVRDRKILDWMNNYSIASKGGRKPVILDGDWEIDTIARNSYKDLDFAAGVDTQEKRVLKALGVPPILLDTGNNANITPNLRLFYLTTVMPLANKYIAALERYFGYDLKPVTQDIQALRPDLREFANYLTSLVNAGILTRNEAREEIRKIKHKADFADDLIIPANIAGSSLNPGEGGRPSNEQ